MASPIKAYWWSPRRSPRVMAVEMRDRGRGWAHLLRPASRAFTNHGDELNEYVLPHVLGRPVEWAPLGREDVLAIGSVIGLYVAHGGRGRIWGSGAAATEIDPAAITGIADRFLAIRGPLARRDLGLPDNLPLGDPGLTVRAFHPKAARRSGTLAIPHFNVYTSAAGRRKIAALREAGYSIMSPTTRPRDMVDAISSAERVVSSGMHGIILSHSLGTPVSAISFADGEPGPMPYKYGDYNASVGLPNRIHSWHNALGDAWKPIHEVALDEVAVVDRRIDDLVEGLFTAAAPLRSGA